MSKTIYQNNIKANCLLVHDDLGYFHLVYQITNLVNGKIYIGKHSTKDPYDNYFGSGKRIELAIKKYGIENFTKEILYCFTDEKEAYLKEEELVTQEFIDRNDTYNIVLGGKGLQKSTYLNEEIRKKLSESHLGERNHNFGKHRSQETKDKISKALKGKYTGERNHNFGNKTPLSQETKSKISKALKGRTLTKEHKISLSKAKIGEKNLNSKAVIKLDEFGNIITEYGCIKDCCAQENISRYILQKLIREHSLFNGFYFGYKI